MKQLALSTSHGVEGNLADCHEPRAHAHHHEIWTTRVTDTAVGLVLLGWMTYLTSGGGGRDDPRLSIFALLVLAATLIVRPWRVLPLLVIALPLSVGAAAFAVTALSPAGWAGTHDAATYAVTAHLFVLVAAWARDGVRRTVVVAAIGLAGAVQFAYAWTAWWGSGDQGTLMVGTFYWHNQAGIFMAAACVAALAVITFGDGPIRRLMWVTGPVAGAGTLFSASRASQIALGIGVLALGVIAALIDRRVAALFRLLLASCSVVVAAWVLAGPPFFAQRMAPGDSTLNRSESFVGNGRARFDHWEQAWDVFLHWPVSGAGFTSFRHAASLVGSDQQAPSVAAAHNGFLQALADGGLLLAVPFWACIVLGLVLSLRALMAPKARDVATYASTPVSLILVLHGGMDFDWSFPALLSMLALALGVATGIRTRAIAPSPVAVRVIIVATVMLLSLAVVGAWDGGLDRNVTFGSAS